MSDDSLSLLVRGQEWSGWQRVAVSRALDSIPASFDIQVTEHFPLSPDITFSPGDPCVVKIGGDVVITGYLDRYETILSAREHTVRISGRSKSEDLVDCSAFLGSPDNPQFYSSGGTALDLARELAKPYGVEVNSLAGAGSNIPGFAVDFGQTPWEIIDRITRYSQLIAYDMPDGSVMLAQAGGVAMASGFSQGVNVEQASVAFSMDERFSEYIAYVLSSYAFSDKSPTLGGKATDGGVPRFRRRYILCEQSKLDQSIAQARAVWEANRRKGRSQAVNLTCDSWRDTAGKLWAINHSAPVNLPALKLTQTDWLIAAVAYLRDEQGQHASIVLMPKGAFEPEPIGDLGIVLKHDIAQNNPTKPDNPKPSTPGAGSNPTGTAGVQGLPGSPSGPSAR